MGEQADEIYTTFALSEQNSEKFDAIVEQFSKYFIPRRKAIFKQARFNTRLQQDGESAEDVVIALHTFSKDCEFGALQEEFERDRLVVGIKDKQLSSRLQLDAELTLPKALDYVRQIERAREPADFKIDTGADETVLPTHVFQTLKDRLLLSAPPCQLRGRDVKLVPVAGVAQLQLICRNHATTQDMICTLLLDKPVFKILQMLIFVNAVADKVNQEEEFLVVFRGIDQR
ncbi:hypothetical protein MRX96_022333 [Rhipicephalus microplus]